MVYSIEFSSRLIEAAKSLEADYESEESDRAILYLSMLSCEIILKALLEKSGFSVNDITNRSHDLKGLLIDIGKCEVEFSISNGCMKWRSASCIKSEIVDKSKANATIGTLLGAEELGASKYPSEIRYGELIKHFPSKLMLQCAIKVLEWANLHRNVIRIKRIS